MADTAYGDATRQPHLGVVRDAAPAPPRPATFGLRDLRDLIARRKWLILFIVIGGTAATLLAVFQLPRVYTSRAELLVDEDDPNLLAADPEPQAPLAYSTKMDTEVDLLTSRNFTGRVVDELGLIDDPTFNTYLPRPQADASYAINRFVMFAWPWEAANGEPAIWQAGTIAEEGGAPADQELAGGGRAGDTGNFEGWAGDIPFASSISSARDWALNVWRVLTGNRAATGGVNGESHEADTRLPLPSVEVQRDRTISALLSKISVDRRADSLVLSVSASDERPETAALLANTFANLYVRWSHERRMGDIRNGVQFLRSHASGLAANIADNEEKIAEYIIQHGLSTDPRDDVLRGSLERLSGEISAAKGDLATATAQLEQSEGADEGRAGPQPSPFLLGLRSEEATLQRERAQLTRNLAAGHPSVIEVEAKLQTVRRSIEEELERIRGARHREVGVAKARVERLEAELANLMNALRERSVAEIRLHELERRLTAEQKLHEVAARKLGQLDPYTSVAKPSVKVVSEAEVPTEPSFPKTNFVAAAGFLGSMSLAFVAAMLAEMLDTRVRDPAAVSGVLKTPVLAEIPVFRRSWTRRKSDVVRELLKRPNGAFARSIRGMYLMCCQPGSSSGCQVLMVTSALPREGKTTLGIGLAITAAQDGRRTVLVDLDLYTGSMPAVLDLDRDTLPIEEFLAGRADLRDTLAITPKVPLLDAIGSGHRSGKSEARLSSAQLDRLLRTLRNSYDFVVIDTPPVLVVEDATWIGSKADAAVVATVWNRTTVGALAEVRDRLALGGVPLVGAALNRVPVSSLQRFSGQVSRSHRRHARRYFAS